MDKKPMKSIAEVALGKNSPIVLQIGTLLALVGGAFYFGAQTRDFVKAQQDATKAQKETADRVEAVQEKLESVVQDRWTYRMHRQYNDELKASNPEIKVPIVSDIREKNNVN